MLKYYFLLIIFIVAMSSLKAQVFIGIKAGTSFSQILYDDTGIRPPVQNYKTGYSGGIILKYFAQPHVGIQAEVNYTQKGWEITQDDNVHEKTLNYIEVPVMSNIYLGKKKTQVFINLGPYVSFLISKDDQQTIVNEEGEYIFEDRSVSEFDYGISVGGGLNRSFTFGTIQLEGRFSQGLNNIFDRFMSIEQSQNQSFNISLAYFFQL